MSKKGKKLGMASVVAVGIGAAALASKKSKEKEQRVIENTTRAYRNTERGKHTKNSKGIYYSNGNYEAFAKPKKPEGVENKNAYIVGGGLASLAAACFLVRDGPDAWKTDSYP